MQLLSERRVGDLVERPFLLGGIPGILWTPGSASPSAPVPVVLAGPPAGPAGLEVTSSLLRRRAGHAARAGIATAVLEMPGSGARAQPPGVERARAELRRALAAGERVSDDIVDRLVLPLVDQAVPEWQAALDALLERPEIADRAGLSGGVIAVGTRLAAIDPRISAAVLFAGSLVPRSVVEEARRVTAPLHVLLQWDDEGNDRQRALELFDAFGSAEKTLNANMGGHTGVPAHAGDEAGRFLARHLGAAGALPTG